MKNREKMHLTFESENLAVPEIHTNEDEEEKDTNDSEESRVVYDNLAMPEIIIRHKKQN